jgi:hypothetical protein
MHYMISQINQVYANNIQHDSTTLVEILYLSITLKLEEVTMPKKQIMDSFFHES